MTRHIVLAIAVTLTAGGVSYPQTRTVATAQEAASGQVENSDTQSTAGATQDKRDKDESISKSLEETKQEVGKALEKTGEKLKETLGMEKRGCLTRGDESDPYILTEKEDGGGDRITVVGSPDLENYIDRMVRVYGDKEGDGRVFHATKVEQIAPSCDPMASVFLGVTKEAKSTTASKQGLTADDQGNTASDRQLTRTIRRAVVADKTLSTYAHNVKIISRDGRVTLKGVVRSEAERQDIEAKAVAAAGAGKVHNELTVQAGSSDQGF